MVVSVSVSAEIASDSSPRTLYVFVVTNQYLSDQSIPKLFNLILKTKSLMLINSCQGTSLSCFMSIIYMEPSRTKQNSHFQVTEACRYWLVFKPLSFLRSDRYKRHELVRMGNIVAAITARHLDMCSASDLQVSGWGGYDHVTSVSFFKIKETYFLDTLIQKILFWIMKINNFRGELTDTSA